MNGGDTHIDGCYGTELVLLEKQCRRHDRNNSLVIYCQDQIENPQPKSTVGTTDIKNHTFYEKERVLVSHENH